MTGPEQTTVNELAREVRALRADLSLMDTKLDAVISFNDRIKGVLELARWAGLTGVAIGVVAILKALGGL